MQDETTPKPVKGIQGYLKVLGPGIAIAATGVGAGDMVAAAAAGSRYGFALIWAVIVGAVLKFVLNEGLARWQLATGTTLLEGWVQKLGRWVQVYFLIYLVLWSFIVGGALISACGLAANAIVPSLSVAIWGTIHSLAAVLFVLIGQYKFFENSMKFFIGFMFLAIVGCAIWIQPAAHTSAQIFTEAAIPAGSPKFILGIIGGVGGSLTLLAYGYWIREKGWHGKKWKSAVNFDLSVSYILTGLFGVGVMVLASSVLHAEAIDVTGSSGVIKMAGLLEEMLGPLGQWAFLFGFWGAVTTSMLGVWQGVPYMFCDFIGLMKELPAEQRREIISSKSKWYRGYLMWLAVVPLVLLLLQKPVELILFYSVVGALFMPFLSATLLYMNSKREWVGDEFRNGWLTTTLLVFCLALFGYLCFEEVVNIFK